MSYYFFAQINIKNQDIYQKYIEKAGEVFSRYSGKYLAVDNSPEVLEGNWDYARAVLIEFPDHASLYEWYNSEEYQEILKYRLEAAKCDTIVIEKKQ